MMDELGKPLGPKELAKTLGISISTVRRNYKKWAGIEVSPGQIKFFENKVREILDASFSSTQGATPQMERRGNSQQDSQGKNVSRRQRKKPSSSAKMGETNQICDEEYKHLNRHGLANIAFSRK